MDDAAVSANWFATLALISWPAIALYFYTTKPIVQATLWTILGGYLLLPSAYTIKFAMLPAIDKYSVCAVSALIGCLFLGNRRRTAGLTLKLEDILVLVCLFVPFVTSELNQDPIFLPTRIIPGTSLYEAVSAFVAEMIILTPFYLGRQFLRDPRDVTVVLRTLILCCLVYSIPMLFEVRMSPQLHSWVYGYFPSDFSQQYRDEGFRPVVFLVHGLEVAVFAAISVLAAAAFWRTRSRVGWFTPTTNFAYLAFVLALCKSLGPALYGFLFAPLVRWAKPVTQMRVAVALVVLAIFYPLLRTSDLVPTNVILEVASSVSADRAASLQTRFDNEKILLDRAKERIWFGWGRFGRSRTFNSEGLDASITDGYWIILLGTSGIFGFVAEFGLLLFCVYRAASAIRYVKSPREGSDLACLALIVALQTLNLLPNSSSDPLRWLFAGALLGVAETLRARRRSRIIGEDGQAVQLAKVG